MSDYDISIAVDRLIEYVDLEENNDFFDLLGDKMIEYLDALGTDSLVFVNKLLIKTIQDGGSNINVNKVSELLDASNNNYNNNQNTQDSIEGLFRELSGAEPPSSLLNSVSTLQTITSSGNLDPNKMTALIRKIIKVPRVQQLLSRVIVEVSERQSGRFWRVALSGT